MEICIPSLSHVFKNTYFLSKWDISQTTNINLRRVRCLPLRAPTHDLWPELAKTRNFVIEGYILLTNSDVEFILYWKQKRHNKAKYCWCLQRFCIAFSRTGMRFVLVIRCVKALYAFRIIPFSNSDLFWHTFASVAREIAWPPQAPTISDLIPLSEVNMKFSWNFEVSCHEQKMSWFLLRRQNFKAVQGQTLIPCSKTFLSLLSSWQVLSIPTLIFQLFLSGMNICISCVSSVKYSEKRTGGDYKENRAGKQAYGGDQQGSEFL
jgi:hypothetical protein